MERDISLSHVTSAETIFSLEQRTDYGVGESITVGADSSRARFISESAEGNTYPIRQNS